MKTIFVVPYAETMFGYICVALSDDGVPVLDALGETVEEAAAELGIGTDSNKDVYDKEYGEGNWQLKFVDDEVAESEEFLLAVKLNNEKFDDEEFEDEEYSEEYSDDTDDEEVQK